MTTDADKASTYERLAWGVVHNAKNTGHGPQPLWACVMAAISQGSTVSAQLCREAGRNPDEMIEGVQEITDDCD